MKQKPIFIDGLGLVEGHFSGVGQYILGVMRGLDEILEDMKYARAEDIPRITIIIPRNSRAKYLEYNFKHIEFKTFPLSFRLMSALWYRGKLPPIDLWCGRGTYIFPRFVDMPLLFSKSALVIFDLSFELYRQYSDEGNAKFLSKSVKRSVGRTRKVITISNNAKKEIADFYDLPSSEVAVATPAADPAVFYRRSDKEITKVKRKYGIKGDYILALSNLEPRKNLSGLIEAYCALPKEVTDKVGLLLVGVSGWKTEALFQDIVKKVEEGYNIMRPSEYVKDKDKPAIISGAKMLVYPSHYEGFGMPPLEALACGVPVITADNSSLPQVVGNAAELVPSDNTQKLQLAMEKYLKDIDSITEKARTNGPEQAAKFNWKASAQVFLDAAKEVEK